MHHVPWPGNCFLTSSFLVKRITTVPKPSFSPHTYTVAPTMIPDNVQPDRPGMLPVLMHMVMLGEGTDFELYWRKKEHVLGAILVAPHLHIVFKGMDADRLANIGVHLHLVLSYICYEVETTETIMVMTPTMVPATPDVDVENMALIVGIFKSAGWELVGD